MRKIFLLFLLSAGLSVQAQAPLTLSRTITLPGVTGKFDHLAADVAHNRIFLAATTHQSVEVVDLKEGKIAQSLTGLGKPHGILWAADTQSLYVADGARKEVRVYKGAPLVLSDAIPLSEDADDMAYDEADHLLFVGHGTGEAATPGRVAVIETEKFTLLANLPVSAHPEALEYDAAGHRVFVNVADSAEIAVVDARTKTITATWKLSDAASNIPLAFDLQRKVLYIACRKPASVLVVNATTGKEMQKEASIPGADDLFYDAAQNRVYVIGGGGDVQTDVVDGAGTLHVLGNVHTAAGAKTGLFVPALKQLFVGVPSDAQHNAELRIFAPTQQ